MDLLRRVPDAGVVRARLARMVGNLGGFAVGCGAVAVLFDLVSVWCFLLRRR